MSLDTVWQNAILDLQKRTKQLEQAVAELQQNQKQSRPLLYIHHPIQSPAEPDKMEKLAKKTIEVLDKVKSDIIEEDKCKHCVNGTYKKTDVFGEVLVGCPFCKGTGIKKPEDKCCETCKNYPQNIMPICLKSDCIHYSAYEPKEPTPTTGTSPATQEDLDKYCKPKDERPVCKICNWTNINLNADGICLGCLDKPKELPQEPDPERAKRLFKIAKEMEVPRKYYCLCGAEMEIVRYEVGWKARCPEWNIRLGFHIEQVGFSETEADLIAELDKLPKKGK